MIRHYDMVTGEVIDDCPAVNDDGQTLHTAEQTSLRLLGIDEAESRGRRLRAPAGAVVMLPVHLLMGE